jgi:hypothetical protein
VAATFTGDFAADFLQVQQRKILHSIFDVVQGAVG